MNRFSDHLAYSLRRVRDIPIPAVLYLLVSVAWQFLNIYILDDSLRLTGASFIDPLLRFVLRVLSAVGGLYLFAVLALLMSGDFPAADYRRIGSVAARRLGKVIGSLFWMLLRVLPRLLLGMLVFLAAALGLGFLLRGSGGIGLLTTVITFALVLFVVLSLVPYIYASAISALCNLKGRRAVTESLRIFRENRRLTRLIALIFIGTAVLLNIPVVLTVEYGYGVDTLVRLILMVLSVALNMVYAGILVSICRTAEPGEAA